MTEDDKKDIKKQLKMIDICVMGAYTLSPNGINSSEIEETMIRLKNLRSTLKKLNII